jgi:zinc D-Ala-D-Ala dipeptidase
LLAFSSFAPACAAGDLPDNFVYLRDIAPTIVQDMRYATAKNFTGAPVPGYNAAECILRREAAEALSRAQARAQAQGLSLKVYDCYRPIRAVKAFVAWAGAPEDGKTKQLYPNLKKSQLLNGYIAAHSGHSTGLAVDVTLVKTPAAEAKTTGSGTGDCTAPASSREPDNSVDMGTAFDCFDPKAKTESRMASSEQRRGRLLLKSILAPEGFSNYAIEWWHYTYGGGKGAAPAQDFPIKPHQ